MATAMGQVVSIRQNRKSELLVKIRTAFLDTPLGHFPTIEKVFKDLAIDQTEISAAEVQLIARRADWPGLRETMLEQRHSISKRELSLTISHRNIELMQLLEGRIKITQRLDMQYLYKGRVLSLDGSIELENYQYDPKSITYSVLALHEIYRSSKFTQDFIASADSKKDQPSISPIMFEQIRKLQKMNDETLTAELEKLNNLAKILEGPSKGDEDEIRRQHGWTGDS
jgi:hypothetical protein